jgi:hypothetical protein
LDDAVLEGFRNKCKFTQKNKDGQKEKRGFAGDISTAVLIQPRLQALQQQF